ncbi:MAG: DUF447 family protein [Planctomycetes bacterium]|nr:DUF447 family protein [Planctomycetota bacterium]
MILEGVVTTLDPDGSVHVSCMGPTVEGAFERLVFRPFPASRTLENLRRTGQGVMHVTDDVELLARAAIGKLAQLPNLLPAPGINGFILSDACRWYAFRVTAIDDRLPRVSVSCRVVAAGCVREFFGFNRAKHAVLEAAILATRVDLVAMRRIRAEMRRLAPLVEKTGGPAEQRAFELIKQHLDDPRHLEPRPEIG